MFKIFLLFCILAPVSSRTTIVSNYVDGIPACLSHCLGLVKPYWREVEGWIFTTVDISRCNFKSRPIVVVTIESMYDVHHAGEVFTVTNKNFNYDVYGNHRRGLATSANNYWKLAWSATGYTC